MSRNHHGSQKDHLARVSSTKKKTFLKVTSLLPKTHFPKIVPKHQLKHLHYLVLNLFPKGGIGNFPLAGRLQYFLENWRILTNDPKILEWVSESKTDFREEPSQEACSNINSRARINQPGGRDSVDKGDQSPGSLKGNKFLSNLVLVPKKDGGTGLLSI